MPKKILIPLSILIIFLTSIYLYAKNQLPKGQVASPLSSDFQKKVSLTDKIKTVLEPKSQLQKLLDLEVQGQKGTYGIYIKNLVDSKNATINPDLKFQSASLYKLWVMAATFQMIKDGQLSEDEILASNKFDLYTALGLDVAQEAKEERLSYSISNAIEQMIVISDNDAAYILTNRIGINKISDFLKRYGFSDSSISQPPTTTARDISNFYQKLYMGEIVDRENSSKMLEMLKRQSLNDRIPKNLPQEVKVAHKTGEIDTFKHDAGIVYGKNPYILVILTDTSSPQEAAQWTADFSKLIYDYFESL